MQNGTNGKYSLTLFHNFTGNAINGQGWKLELKDEYKLEEDENHQYYIVQMK